ncbi:hypothetical protein BGW38_001400 [Lunasporangiospora selenospora]|uniref:Ion transport domain-containing protein n=1 Tax=Lunasporangiospora selenospora TaxID=979761 RepID=A0A9P6G1H5_9FUNG|nr:hypothetical protein BGW38_001400 [Lunasporangiospora selenospora]
MQVFLRQSEFLLGLFVAIAALSCLFLWLEILQWLESRQYLRSRKDPQDANTSSPYFRSSYNYLDIIVYVFPLVASVHQLLNTVLDVQNAATWDFSFCAVLVPIHLVAELRVSEIACKYVVIISGLLARVRFFFINFVAAILVFSLVILHALYSYKANINDDEEQSFPSSLYDAISVIYLALSGRYDPTAEGSLSTKQDDDKTPYRNMPLQIIVMIFFFMISILIATINESFFGENDKWRRHWLDNRLRYVESAENLSYHIPGLRQTFRWFPSRIYYTATSNQAWQFWERTKDIDEDIRLMRDEDEPKSNQDIASSSIIFSRIDGIEKQIDYTHRQRSSDTRSNFEQFRQTLDERLEQQDRKVMKLLEQQRLEYKRDMVELRQEITQQNTWVHNRLDETWQALREQRSELAELKLTSAKTQESVEEVTRCIHVLMDTFQLAMKETRPLVRSEKNEKILGLEEHKEE